MAIQAQQVRCGAAPRWTPEDAARREFELLRLLSTDRRAQQLYIRRCAAEKAAAAQHLKVQAAAGSQRQPSARHKPGQKELRARRAARTLQAGVRGMLARRKAVALFHHSMPQQPAAQRRLNTQAPVFVT